MTSGRALQSNEAEAHERPRSSRTSSDLVAHPGFAILTLNLFTTCCWRPDVSPHGPNPRKAAFERRTLRGSLTLYLKRKWTWIVERSSKRFHGGWTGLRAVNCLRHRINSGVQKSKKKKRVLEPLDPDVTSNQPNFCINFIYIVWREKTLGLCFTVLVCTRCCLQKRKIKFNKNK